MFNRSAVGASLFTITALVLAALSAGCSGEPEPAAFAVAEAGGALRIVVGTAATSCDDLTNPTFPEVDCGEWRLSIHLAPAAQAAGTYPISGGDVSAENDLATGDEGSAFGGGSCLIEGGDFNRGTIAISAIDGESVAFTLDGTAAPGFAADGDYVATRCQ